MQSRRRLAVVAGGALLLLVLIAVVGVLAARAPVGSGADPTPPPSPTATRSAQPSPSVEPLSSAEVAVALAEIERQVELIRELPPADIGPAEFITRRQLEQELLEIFDEDYPPEERAADNVVLRALGLLEPDQDVAELQLRLLSEGVLGFYDDEERRMVVVSDAGLDAVAKLTYAHEYTHALQDAAFGLESLETDADGEDDRSLARLALVEGDAQNSMVLWAFENLSEGEIAEVLASALPDTTGMPGWLVRYIDFPYTTGLEWVQRIYFTSGMRTVDEAFADPPSSTEQVMHPEKWEAREEPIAVEVIDLAAELGAGWREVDATPIGEAMLRMMLEHVGAEREVAAAGADGWGGDRLVVTSGPDGAFALTWRLAWDGPADADEFEDAYELALAALDFPAQMVRLSPTDHLVVHASSLELLVAAREAAD